jgi:uncharacterized membrane protein
VSPAAAGAASASRRLGIAAFWALLGWQLVWHGLWLPPETLPRWVPLAVFGLPLLPPAIGLLRRRPSALFWAAAISLLHLCHAISEGWSDPPVRPAAAVEAALALLLIGAVGYDGLQRRRAARRRPPAH